ncbi:cytidylate kinase [Jeotgalibacillus malaysiensis]|uniref:Cytidylate kinase n=1 Tax=Jeotgalibacillus malaysiensis TaxID=1508404 RepID=A0A0B5AM97_9BACL|nr:(d)CMP kinase [Jeotgalibacillus malaysiensis]AJD91320.1 cytidylate kinase [Jeotgalibacillus malaysiensis]
MNNTKKIRIALDGPAAAGKSTAAKKIAEKLGFIYIDTGAMYRTLTYKALKNQIDPKNEQELYNLLLNTVIELKPGIDGQLVYLDGKEVTTEIRQQDVTQNVSDVALHQLVRSEMVRRQQELVKNGGIVMDGRDIGTAVIPDAELKIFMSATAEERARRRFEEHQKQGIESDLHVLQAEIEKRDHIDSTRAVSPLVKAEDAIELDTTHMSISEVVNKVTELAADRGAV